MIFFLITRISQTSKKVYNEISSLGNSLPTYSTTGQWVGRHGIPSLLVSLVQIGLGFITIREKSKQSMMLTY